MRRFLAAQFAPVLRAWRNGYEAEVRRAAIAFFLLVFLAFGVCLAVPEAAARLFRLSLAREDRNTDYLKRTVRDIVGAVCETNDALGVAFPSLHTKLDREVFFITTQELEDMYPDKTPKERENEILRQHHTVFLMQIGGKLKSGKPHDGRAPDYDDWDLNGDILMWNPVLQCAFEISSMGIRVDEKSLDRQLTLAGCDDRRSLPFHKMLLSGELPLTMGGGIGQSRLCMLMIGQSLPRQQTGHPPGHQRCQKHRR